MSINSQTSQTPSDPNSPKARLAATDAELASRYWEHAQVLDLISERTAFVDQLLLELWHEHIQTDELALYALGGYGRSELLPHSDLDILVVGPKPKQHAAAIEGFLHDLFDLHIEIGHSVRALKEIKASAREDLTIATALFERRALHTSEVIDTKLTSIADHKRLWPEVDFYRAKIDEQERRHRDYADAEYSLEPNIKESPGGLRDLHTVMWVYQRSFGTSNPEKLRELGVLTKQEQEWLQGGRRYLLWVRFGLHLIAGRKDERLQFEYQRTLAERLGYVDTAAKLGVERYMQQYYTHVLTLREVNDIMLQHFDEAVVRGKKRARITPINERFQLHGDYIEATADDIFERRPSALLEIFVLMANRRDVSGVRADTIRQIRGSLHLIDDSFRSDPDNTGLFIALLKSPYSLVSQLNRMRRYGVLSRYIPEFGAVVGQMQHDLFHIYTVDAHTMQVMRNMQSFRYRSAEKVHPVAAHCVRAIAKIELLYLAGLYHDIGKGRGGDHSTLGAEDARTFCARHGLSSSDTDLVDWLVRSHLLMSSTAQRQDIYDPEVISAFANEVKSERRLNYLYALTVADINATNPKLWNNWRATLLRQLYSETRRALRRGLESPLDRQDSIDDCRSWAAERLQKKGLSDNAINQIWAIVEDEFFLRHTPREVAELALRIHEHALQDGPLILVRELGQQLNEGGATQIYVYMKDQPEIFAATVTTLDRFNLSVWEANIFTGPEGDCFNRFVVLDEDGNQTADKSLWKRVQTALEEALLAPQSVDLSSRLLPRRVRQLMRESEVKLHTDDDTNTSELAITASDRPGLLARIGLLFVELELSLIDARIMTLGDRVEDSFLITDRDGNAIHDQQRAYELENHIRQALDRDTSGD